MGADVICAEHIATGRTCEQGKANCRRPLLCSGATQEVESAIRLCRAMNSPLERESDEPLYSAEEAMTWPEKAILTVAAVVAAAVIATGVYQVWPLLAVAVF
jgi:hypothetical protein